MNSPCVRIWFPPENGLKELTLEFFDPQYAISLAIEWMALMVVHEQYEKLF